MSPVRAHLLLLSTTGAFCTAAFVLNFLYVQRDEKGGECIQGRAQF